MQKKQGESVNYSECDYGKGLFDKSDFITLRDKLASAKGNWMVSINNVPQIRELFADFHIREVKTSYSIASAGNKPVTELLITNFLPSLPAV